MPRSVLAGDRCQQWLADMRERFYTLARRVPLEQVHGWQTAPEAPAIRHHTGRFFSIDGLTARIDGVPAWVQPIVHQDDIGVLGLLIAERDGHLAALVQAKPEPGNINGVQVSTTVQATHSNYSQVHGGRPVPYLDLFLQPGTGRVVVDSRQSEHGSVFFRKRNRNMVVAVDQPPPALDGFCWLPLAEVYQLLHVDDLVSMDLRTVLGCLPRQPAAAGNGHHAVDGDPEFVRALQRSADPGAPARHRLPDLLHWITGDRCRHRVEIARMPLPELTGWRRTDGMLQRTDGLPFRLIGVDVEAAGREVHSWSQPMVEVPGTGLLALLVTRINGVLHLQMQPRVEPGMVDVAELAPSVQQLPGDPDPSSTVGELRQLALSAPPTAVRFDTVLSEEGGRFFHTRNRHLIVEVPADHCPPGHRWLTLHQVRELLQHSYYVNVQARSLLSCLSALMDPASRVGRW